MAIDRWLQINSATDTLVWSASPSTGGSDYALAASGTGGSSSPPYNEMGWRQTVVVPILAIDSATDVVEWDD